MAANLVLPGGDRDTCIPLRRHSFSAPPSLVLDSCLDKAARLSKKLDSVIDRVRQNSRSVSDLSSLAVVGQSEQVDKVVKQVSGCIRSVPESILDELLESIVATVNMPSRGQCHHCHRPLHHPEHSGVGSGQNRCTLDHFGLCPGGRKAGKDWTACPTTDEDTDFDENEDEPTGTDDSLQVKVPLKDESSNSEEGLKLGKLDADSVSVSLAIAASQAERVLLDQEVVELEETEDEEERHLQEQIQKLQLQVELDSQAKLKAQERERQEKKRLKKERLEKLEKKRADLMRSLQTKTAVPSLPARSTEPASRSVSNSYVVGSGELEGSKTLQEKASGLAARQQRKTAENLHKNMDGLTMAGIRALPGYTPEVEQYLTQFQEIVPSMSKAPTAPSASGRSFQPAGVMLEQTRNQHTQSQGGEELATEVVYSASRGKFVSVVRDSPDGLPQPSLKKSQARSVLPASTGEDELTSEDEDCPVEPAKGHKFVWYRDRQGKKYFVHKVVKDSYTPEMVKTYLCDESTGRWYESMVPKDSGQTGARPNPPLSTPAYVDHRTSSKTPIPLVSRGLRTPIPLLHPAKVDRFPGYIQGDPEKQGKDTKVPDLVQWARNCPVNWTNKITSDKISVLLWAWAFVSELLATRTGQAANLQPGELEARLQHFCNVLEITLQSSTQFDFCTDAWSVARLYHQKVQYKVDSNQFTWTQLSTINHGASHPHELMAAHQELAKKVTARNNGAGDKGGKGGKGDKGDQPAKSKLRCPTWNKSEVRGKCQWEIDNAPVKCIRVHECTYCKSKSYTPVNHQRSFCGKRLEEEG